MQTDSANKNVMEKSIFSLSIPIFIDLSLHFVTFFINTLMVGRVAFEHVSAMAIGNQVFDLCITIFSFISVGCSVVILQYLGSGNQEQIRKVVHISVAFNILLGCLFSFLVIAFGYVALQKMNTPPEIFDNSYHYLKILGVCLIPEAISLILAACLRSYGKASAAMYVTLIVNIITVIGNFIVLYGIFGVPKMGLIGVAWSTVLGRTIAVILLFFLVRRGLRFRFELVEFFRWNKKILLQILKIGLPAAGENLVWFLHIMVALAFIALLGKDVIAAQTIYFQLALFMMLFGIAISIGNEILVGHLVGAKRFDDAYKRTFKSLKTGLIVTIFVAILFWIFKMPIVDFITQAKTGEAAGSYTIKAMLIPLFGLGVFLEPGRTFNIVMVNALRATGDARFPFYIAIFSMWGIALPVGYFLGIKMEMGLLGIWLGFFFDEWVRGLINCWRWYSRKWESKRLIM